MAIRSNRPQVKSAPGQIGPSQIGPKSNRIICYIYIVYVYDKKKWYVIKKTTNKKNQVNFQ
jgi:hypothetical protein